MQMAAKRLPSACCCRLQETACNVFTFDCTFAGNSLGPRHQYHKASTKPKVGTNMGLAGQQTDLEFKSYSDITKMLKHTKVDLLKIDIEGAQRAWARQAGQRWLYGDAACMAWMLLRPVQRCPPPLHAHHL